MKKVNKPIDKEKELQQLYGFINDAIDKCIKYKPQQHRAELFDFLLFAIQKGCKSVLEIGSYDGGLTAIFAELFESVVAIDLEHKAKYEMHNIIKITCNTQTLSIGELQDIARHEKYDLIFIDGAHSYDAVKKDYETFESMLNEGGLIALHDIKDSEGHIEHKCFVHNFWKDLKFVRKYETTKPLEFISNKNTWLANINPKYKDRMGEFGGIGVIYN